MPTDPVTTQCIRLLLVDDHTLLRDTLGERLEREPDMAVVGVADDAGKAVELARSLQPDVAVMDIDMPGTDSFAAALEIRHDNPRTRVLFLSAFVQDRYIEEALRVQARGYVTKREAAEVLVNAIRQVAAGRVYFSDDVRSRLVLGDGEASMAAILDAYKELKAAGVPRREMIALLARRFEWIYAPSLYDVDYHADGTVRRIAPRDATLPSRIERCQTDEFDKAPFPTRPIVPFVEVVHDRFAIEIMRGCPQRCRFCHAGYTKRPLRTRSVDQIMSMAEEMYWSTGMEEFGLLSLSTADYPDLRDALQDGGRGAAGAVPDRRRHARARPGAPAAQDRRHRPRARGHRRGGGADRHGQADARRRPHHPRPTPRGPCRRAAFRFPPSRRSSHHDFFAHFTMMSSSRISPQSVKSRVVSIRKFEPDGLRSAWKRSRS